MQHPIVMSFRARLRFCGYTDIHIKSVRKKFNNQDIYLVSCRDPFAHLYCERYMSMVDMFEWR